MIVSEQDVIVVGAGAVGLVTALGLARAGVSVRILEASSAVSTEAHDMIYSWSVLDGLEELGILDECVSRGLVTTTWTYRSPRTDDRATFDLGVVASDFAHPFNVHLTRAALTDVVLQEMDRLPGAVVEWGTTVTDVVPDEHGVSVTAAHADGERVYRAAWTVGADGARSIVRRRLGLGFAGITWPDRFVSTNLRLDFAALGYDTDGYQIDPEFGAVVSAVDRRGLWRYVHAEPRTLDETTAGLRAQDILRQVLPAGTPLDLDGSYPYRIHERSAPRFRVGRVLLVGDAAHVTNATLASGMSSGLFDAYLLTEALTAVVLDGADAEILDRYSDARHRNFWEYASPASVAAKELVFPSDSSSRPREALANLQRIAADPDRMRNHIEEAGRFASASLLTSGHVGS